MLVRLLLPGEDIDSKFWQIPLISFDYQIISFDYKINSFNFLSLKICNAMAEEPSIRWNTLFSEELQQSEIGKKAALIVQWDTCSIQPTQIWPPRQPSATRYNSIRVQYWTAQYPEGWTDCIWAQYFCNLTRLDLITMAKAMESMIEFICKNICCT